MTKLSSGEIAPKTATYNMVASNGKVVRTVKVKKGDRMPPTPKADYYFELNQPNCKEKAHEYGLFS